jgi:phosphoribosyl-ATP pyrophosphohydrolase/phosphoribosyl-AMP cyclohydrolase
MDTIDFSKGNGLVPVIVQDYLTNKVLMLAYMNEEALEKTQKEKIVTFYSRSKSRLWTKGETSGNYLHVKEILSDCDKDTLLIKVKPAGPACHTGSDTCFSEENISRIEFLAELEDFLSCRKNELPEGSYTTHLFNSGTPKIAQKVGEEAVELVIESLLKDNDDDFLNESADLVYHLIVLLLNRGYKLEDVAAVLKSRHK